MSKTCERCNGSGTIKRVEHTMFGNSMVKEPCPDCEGTGIINTPDPKPHNRATVKIYSNTGQLISEWNNVFHADVKERGVVNLTLTDMTTVALIGGVVIVEEVYKGDK